MPARDIVSVLQEDPDLGNRLSAEELEAAQRRLLGRVEAVDAGEWDPRDVGGRLEWPAVGLLLLEGLLLREAAVAGRSGTELLGAHDLLRPWDQDGDSGLIRLDVRWRVIEPIRMAVLDRQFLTAGCDWPHVLDALFSRTLRRSRWLAFQAGLKQITRVEGRLLVLLWSLSERWGVVTPRGVHIRLRLTHDVLAKLVGARRPSVTTALGVLTSDGEIERLRDGYLLLRDQEGALRRASGGDDERFHVAQLRE